MAKQGFNIPSHWWGKIIGATIGLLRGGITGALLGLFVGHLIDRFIYGLGGGVSRTRDAFFGAVFSTLGHISKADGRVTQAEINAAEALMRRLNLTEEERQRAIRFFQQGKAPGFDLEAVLTEFVRHSMFRHDLRIMFIELVLQAAMADGNISTAEQAVLARICAALHIPENIFVAMLRARQGGAYAYAGQSAGGGARPPVRGGSLKQAYATLGLKEDAGAAQVKSAYRKLISQYHPDKLVSRGLPEEMMEVAKTRVREINAAYDAIKAAKGIK